MPYDIVIQKKTLSNKRTGDIPSLENCYILGLSPNAISATIPELSVKIASKFFSLISNSTSKFVQRFCLEILKSCDESAFGDRPILLNCCFIYSDQTTVQQFSNLTADLFYIKIFFKRKPGGFRVYFVMPFHFGHNFLLIRVDRLPLHTLQCSIGHCPCRTSWRNQPDATAPLA